MVEKQKLTERAILRTRALISMKDALLPGFCEGLVCNNTCPFYSNLPGNEPCAWQKTYRAINLMEQVLLKDEEEDYAQRPN